MYRYLADDMNPSGAKRDTKTLPENDSG